MALKNDLIEIALNDIRSASLLYDKKLYAQSFFLFQQASEKANKAYGLCVGLITEKEAKESIGHNQLKIHRKAVVAEQKELESTLKILANNPDVANHTYLKGKDIGAYSERLQEGLKFHDSAKQKELLNYTQESLDYFLDAIEELCYLRFKLGKKAKENVLNELKNYEDFGKSFFAEKDKMDLIEAMKEDNRDQLISVVQQFSKHQIKSLFMLVTFYFCAIVTIRHSTLSRYPDETNNPLTFYSRSNPSVKNQPYFIYYLKRALVLLRKYEAMGESNKKLHT